MAPRRSTRLKTIRAADLFCGAGGTSTGLLRAAARMGRNVELLAVNHWQDAISTHELNHPGVRHLRGDLEAIDPRVAVPGGELDLLLASPECTSHSYSRGGRPISEQSRSTAWCPLKWCDQLNVKAFVIENVPAFRQWGPTNRNGRPIAARKGETYRQWLDMFRSLGYTVDVRVLNAADYGAATTRRRCYIIGVKGARKVRWPEPTHAPGGMLLGRQPWRGAKEIIDWSLQGQSIFNRKKPLAPKTRERIVMGAEKFWPALRPYLAILRNHMGARDVNEPVPTLAAGGQHMGLVEPILVSVAHGDNAKSSGRGNGGRARSATEPMPTITGSREHGVAEAAFIVRSEFSHGDGKAARSVEDPLQTITTAPGTVALVEPFLTSAGGSWEDRPQSINDPVRTILATESKAIVEPFVVVNRTNNVPKSIDAPLPVLNTGGNMGLVEPFILPHRVFDKMAVDSVDDPMRTITAHGHAELVQPFILPHRQFDEMRVDSIDNPIRTLTAKGGSDFGLVEPVVTEEDAAESAAARPFLVPFFGEREGQPPRVHSIDEPLPTVTSHGAGGVTSPFLVSYYGNGQPHDVAKPIGTLTTKDRYGLVTPHGIQLAEGLYLDIRFRMLRPHELAAAMGFPAGYQFTGTVDAQVKQIGNAVEVHQAEALCFTVLA